MKYCFYAVLLIAFFGCQPAGNKITSEKDNTEKSVDSTILISCEGVGDIKIDFTYAELQKLVGARSLTPHENTLYGKYTTVWENKPNSVNVYWAEKNPPYKTIKFLEVNSLGSPYLTRDSMQVGLDLRTLVRMNNNMPLTFRNFYAADNNGLITSFNNGPLGENKSCVQGILEWTSQENVYKDRYEEFKKQEIVESHEKILNNMEVQLSSIRVLNKNR